MFWLGILIGLVIALAILLIWSVCVVAGRADEMDQQ